MNNIPLELGPARIPREWERSAMPCSASAPQCAPGRPMGAQAAQAGVSRRPHTSPGPGVILLPDLVKFTIMRLYTIFNACIIFFPR